MLDFVTYSWAGIGLLMLWRLRTRALLHPLFHYAVAHLVYFSEPPRWNEQLVGIAHLVSSLSLIAGYYTVVKGLAKPRSAPPQSKPMRLDNHKVRYLALGLLLLTTLSWPLLAMNAGYRLFDILTSFYSEKVKLSGLDPISGALAVFTKLGFMGVVLGRIWFNMDSSRLFRQLYAAAYAVVLVVIFATGIRSGLVFLFLSLLLTDLYCEHVLGKKPDRKSRLFLYLSSASLIVLGVVFLTAFRSHAFSDAREMREELVEAVGDGRMRTAAKEAAIQNTNDCIAFSLERYADSSSIGRGLFTNFVNPVPRVFWPQKPVGFGKVLAHEMAGTPLEPRGLSLAAGIAGEAFYNGRWSGVVVLSFLFGALFGAARRLIVGTADPARAAGGLFFLASLTGVIRGDWLSLNTNLYYVATTLAILAVLRVLFGGPRTVLFAKKSPARSASPALPPAPARPGVVP